MSVVSTMLKNCFCKLGLHDWHFYTQGRLHQVFVYPVRYRAFLNCKKLQQRVFDQRSQMTSWQDAK